MSPRKEGERAPVITMETVGRQTLRQAVWPAQGRAKGRPILFFNGIGANLELVQPLGEAMTDRDVLTFDMPGIGGSPAPRVPYRPWWVAHAANTLVKRAGYDKVDVIGVSWGGGAAQQFAFQHRNRTNRLILAATSSGMTMVPGDWGVLSKMATPQRYVDPNYLKKNFEKLYGEGDHVMEDHMIRIMAPSMRGYFAQMAAMLGWTSLPFLPFLSCPTLIMAGDRDRIVPLVNARMLNAFIRSSKLHVVEGGGHLFIVSRLKQIMPVIRGFLDGDR